MKACLKNGQGKDRETDRMFQKWVDLRSGIYHFRH